MTDPEILREVAQFIEKGGEVDWAKGIERIADRLETVEATITGNLKYT